MDPVDRRARFADARVARLATVTATGSPHLVPVVFVLLGEDVYSAIDAKPKTTTALRRLDNIRATGQACLLVDHYDEDWSRLWWVRVDGAAEVLDAASEEGAAAIRSLVGKYPQYVDAVPAGPVVAVRIGRWRAWSADLSQRLPRRADPPLEV